MYRSDERHQPNRECRDAVYGFVYLSEAEWAIVDCPTFQRLRDIRQLAMAHLVYPGATHTRFEHSLGCLHLSNQIYQAVMRQVKQKACPNFAQAFGADDEQIKDGHKVLRLAGLLHDLGHPPFSHSGENLMPEIENNGKKRRVKHEEMTAKLIRETEVADKLRDGFGKEIIEEVIAAATSPELAELKPGSNLAWHRFLNDIIAGELGSDRMDYLLRDAMHSGLTVGQFDYRKLIDSMAIVPPPEETGEEHRLGLDGAGWLMGEHMVVARYLMYVALYFHKTKRIYELHLEEFLQRWLQERYKGKPFFPVDNPRAYVCLTDSTVWAAIYNAALGAESDLKVLARPFVDRSHRRLACEVILADNSKLVAPRELLQELVHGIGEKLGGTAPQAVPEAEYANAFGESLRTMLTGRRPRVWDEKRFDKLVAAANDHVRHKFSESILKDVTKHGAVKFFGPRDRIWVFLDGKTRYLDDLSEIVSGMPDKIWRGRVYAEESIREDVKSFCEKWLGDNPPAVGDADAGSER